MDFVTPFGGGSEGVTTLLIDLTRTRAYWMLNKHKSSEIVA